MPPSAPTPGEICARSESLRPSLLPSPPCLRPLPPLPPGQVDFRAFVDTEWRRPPGRSGTDDASMMGDPAAIGVAQSEQQSAAAFARQSTAPPPVAAPQNFAAAYGTYAAEGAASGAALQRQTLQLQELQQQYSNRYASPAGSPGGGGAASAAAGGGDGLAGAGSPGGGPPVPGSSPFASSFNGAFVSNSPSAYFSPGGSVVTLPVQAESSLGFSNGSTPQRSTAQPTQLQPSSLSESSSGSPVIGAGASPRGQASFR